MPKKKAPAYKGGVTDGDTVTVPIQREEDDVMLVPTARASELTLDRGDVSADATIRFTVKPKDVPKGRKQIQITHALVNDERQRVWPSVMTTDVGTPPQKAVRLWTVCFKEKKRDYGIGTEVRVWRKSCNVPDDLKEAFASSRDVKNLEAVAGRHVVPSTYQPRLLLGAHMYQCDVANWQDQLRVDLGGWSKAEAWNTARNQVIANAATGLNNMENAPLFLWLPETHKENARNSLEHKWIGWEPGATVHSRLVPTRRRISHCFHKDVVHYCACA